MEKSKKGQFNEQIRERTIKMAVDIHELFISKTVSPITRPIVNHLPTSGARLLRVPTVSCQPERYPGEI